MVPEHVGRLFDLAPKEPAGLVHCLGVLDESAQALHSLGDLHRLLDARLQGRGVLAQNGVEGPPEILLHRLALDLADGRGVPSATLHLRQQIHARAAEARGHRAKDAEQDVGGIRAGDLLQPQGLLRIAQRTEIPDELLQEHLLLGESVGLPVLAELFLDGFPDRHRHAGVELLVGTRRDACSRKEVLQRANALVPVQLQRSVEVRAVEHGLFQGPMLIQHESELGLELQLLLAEGRRATWQAAACCRDRGLVIRSHALRRIGAWVGGWNRRWWSRGQREVVGAIEGFLKLLPCQAVVLELADVAELVVADQGHRCRPEQVLRSWRRLPRHLEQGDRSGHRTIRAQIIVVDPLTFPLLLLDAVLLAVTFAGNAIDSSRSAGSSGLALPNVRLPVLCAGAVVVAQSLVLVLVVRRRPRAGSRGVLEAGVVVVDDDAVAAFRHVRQQEGPVSIDDVALHVCRRCRLLHLLLEVQASTAIQQDHRTHFRLLLKLLKLLDNLGVA
mmetsp:Transcript_11564/g.30446  ORF Transcript_11564/g.30446 Transcript_11564/m.30446 type:complete len:501 (-) Transcript_11564:310-1812(-)